MTSYLSTEEVVALHDEMIARYGGSLGVRSPDLLDSAVYRCQATFGGNELYRTIFEKAAAFFHGILFDHAFVDGNKRTALVGTAMFLAKNGFEFEANDRELVNLPLFVEESRPDISGIAKWFKDHSKKRLKRANLI